MSNYQFVVFSGKEQNRLGMKREEIINESNESSPSRQNDVDYVDSPLSSRASSSSSSSRKHLIVLPTLESSSSSSSSSNTGRKTNCDLRKQQHCIESRPPRSRESPSNVVVHSSSRQSSLSSHQHQRTQFNDASAMQLGGKCANNNAPGKAKIPRPANAFMLFANEWRKKLAVENPRESNKDISVRLVLFIFPFMQKPNNNSNN
ncbi:hypothetical protein PV328_008172 [Microctonus aethiopoides]|uniref:HMG box domain-containing protein n=1 Tax=Microctonus aethiopoides TaxID=144406 RepID=A0AA39CAV1_9HYME|nr:hypothetical protein PV328_008172 [Microctonus aethiopoides]